MRAAVARGLALSVREGRIRATTAAGDEDIVGAVQRIAGDRGVPMAQVALALVLANPVVSAPIIGPTKPHHLADAVAARTRRVRPPR